MRFNNFMTDIVSLIKTDGQEYSNIKSSVQKNKIFINDSNLPIEEGDHFIRLLANGLQEVYLVLDRGYYEGFGGIKAHYQSEVKKVPSMPSKTKKLQAATEKIFLSYSWNDNKVADSFEIMFRTKGINLTRDLRDVEYRQSLKEFMKNVRKSDYVLMIISEHYLKSINCMYEVLEFVKDDDYKERILPLVQKETDIFNAIGRSKYIKYWQNEFERLHHEMQGLDELNRTDIVNELKKVESIQRQLTDFLSIIADMNMVTFEENITGKDFYMIFNLVRPSKNKEQDVPMGYYVLNVPRTITSDVMTWWANGNRTYTDDLNEARIFTEIEILGFFNDEHKSKKFAGFPILELVSKFNQPIVPFKGKFLSIIENNQKEILGNSNIYLDEEEVKLYI
ncbi:toll/interleukin-1 receptor domain-containing protein [Cohnella soli]|uniref:Toll/interleukin-1 receptor domain-containing protein n=1 Tax=Cohnella soli TaxID=425005 RepID=A0ABW0HY95_9BACL